MSSSETLRSEKAKLAEKKDAWNHLKVDFSLEARKFPNNKIYGVITVEPDSARALIDHFVLVVPGESDESKAEVRLAFSGSYERISATGWSNRKKDRCVQIEAVPIEQLQDIVSPIRSRRCAFSFTGKLLSPSPMLTFERENSKLSLVVKWDHLGDALADQYIMYIDGVDVQYIRRKLINDMFEVRIDGFQPGQKHTFQLVAKLRHSRHTHESDLLEFTVPDLVSLKRDPVVEYITLEDEPMPANLPIVLKDASDETESSSEDIAENLKDRTKQDRVTPDKSRTASTCESSTSSHAHETCTGCQHLPHTKFPGFDHYLRNNTSPALSSRKSSSTKYQQQTSALADDDDDVVTSPEDGKLKK